jgi:Tol biopolymer transport system component
MSSSKSSWDPLRAAGWVIVAILLIGNAAWGTYSGQNGQIVFVAHFTDSWQLYTINPDGSDMFQVTNLPPTDNPSPDYSPDGRKIVFCHDMTGAVELYIINADGTGLTQLTSDNTENIFPRWSPDGTQIVFSTLFNGDFGAHHLATINADGSGRKVITNILFDDFEAEYTADGKHIIFGSTADNLISAIWMMDTDGRHKKRITEPALKVGGPDVSPDGTRMVVFDQQNTDRPSTILVGDLDGTHLKRLTRIKNLNALGASYSPDGTKFVFNGAVPEGGDFNIYMMNVDGSDITLFLSCPGGCLFPDWGSKP